MNKEIYIIEQRLQALMEKHKQFIDKMDIRIKNLEIESSIVICNLSEIFGDVDKTLPKVILEKKDE